MPGTVHVISAYRLTLLLQVEEMLMLPLQPCTSADSAARRWVRQDFRMRRKMFMEEVAKLAVEGPMHKIEVRRGRCFKDSMSVFAGKVRTGAEGWLSMCRSERVIEGAEGCQC